MTKRPVGSTIGRQAGAVSGDSAFVAGSIDRKSTRLNSSHVAISYAVFCLKKKNQPRGGADGLGVAKAADVPQLAEHHLGGHESHSGCRFDDLAGLSLPPGRLGGERLDLLG